jgi:hypothetical protein
MPQLVVGGQLMRRTNPSRSRFMQEEVSFWDVSFAA